MVSREHHRVRIRLPARLRWTTPFGQKIELSETIDVSRGGLLLSSREWHAAGVPLWVTFPYDASLPECQPEVLARIVRCAELSPARGHLPWRFISKRRHARVRTGTALCVIPSGAAALAARSPFLFACGRNTFRGLRKPCRLIFLREACAFALTANMPRVSC